MTTTPQPPDGLKAASYGHPAMPLGPATSAETLAKVAESGYTLVRERVAEHVNTSPETLSLLAADGAAAVRRRVARNPHTPPAVLALLATDADPTVRRAAPSAVRRVRNPAWDRSGTTLAA